MKDTHDQDAQISASLETLVRHVTEASLKELAALRVALDRQISSVEARLDASNHQPAIDATVSILAHVTGERVDHARHQIGTAAEQALAANAMLHTALDNAKQQLEAAQATAARADADRKAMAAQLLDVQVRLRKSEQETGALAAERVELQQRLDDASTARATAEAQYQQLLIASQRLTEGLSQTLRQEREQVRTIAAAFAPASTETVPKKPLKFSAKARDAKRVKIRRGIQVTVDGIPGELVDLSVGGAQAALRQLVKPNQLVQLALPTTTGELLCKGRIVWTFYEQSGTSLSVYRTGVKFTDVDAAAIETFMADFCEKPPVQSHRSSGIA